MDEATQPLSRVHMFDTTTGVLVTDPDLPEASQASPDGQQRRASQSSGSDGVDGSDDDGVADDSAGDDEEDDIPDRSRWVVAGAIACALVMVALVVGVVINTVSTKRAEDRAKARVAEQEAWSDATVLTIDGIEFSRAALSDTSKPGGKPSAASLRMATTMVDIVRDRNVLSTLGGDDAPDSDLLTGMPTTLADAGDVASDLQAAVWKALRGRNAHAARARYDATKDELYSHWCLVAVGWGTPVADAGFLNEVLWKTQQGMSLDDAKIAAQSARGWETSEPGSTARGCETSETWLNSDLPQDVHDRLKAEPVGTVVGPIGIPVDGFFTWDYPDVVRENGGASGIFQLTQKYEEFDMLKYSIIDELSGEQLELLRTAAVSDLAIEVDPTFGHLTRKGTSVSFAS